MSSHPFITSVEKNIIVQLKASGLSVADISYRLSRPQSTIYHILALYRRTGSVVTHDLPTGAPRKLTSLDLQVRCGSDIKTFVLLTLLLVHQRFSRTKA